jgi:hypothetical protein
MTNVISFKLCLLCYRKRAPCTMDLMARVLSLVGVRKEIFLPCSKRNKIQVQPYRVTVMITVITQLSERKKEKNSQKYGEKTRRIFITHFVVPFQLMIYKNDIKHAARGSHAARQFFIRPSQWSEWHSNSYLAWLGAQKNCSSLIHTCFFHHGSDGSKRSAIAEGQLTTVSKQMSELGKFQIPMITTHLILSLKLKTPLNSVF